MTGRIAALLVLVMLVSACDPEATPLPVNLPTLPPATTTAPAPEEQELRYALAPGLAAFLSAEDERLISASAAILPLDAPPTAADLGLPYDILVAFSEFEDSTEAPARLQVNLLVNTTLAPLDDPDIAVIIRQAVDPQAIATVLGIPPEQAGAAPAPSAQALRTNLANAGYPDGFDLTLAADFPAGAETIVQHLARVNIDVRLVPAGETAQLTLTSMPTASQNFDESIDLLHISIYYRAVPGLDVTFTPAGFPIITS
jgi:hypothetical protein